MTLDLQTRPRVGRGPGPVADPVGPEPGSRPLLLRWVAATAACSVAAPAWILASSFHGSAATVIVLAVAIGAVVLTAAVSRARFSGPLTVLAPVALFALVVVAASRTSEGLVGAAWEAIRSGQLAAPPVRFTPGWQVVCAALLISLAAATVQAALALRSMRVAALLPLPVLIALVLTQSPGRQLTATLPALLLTMLALALAERGERARDGRAEPVGLRDLVRVGLGLGVVAAVLVGAVNAGLLGMVRSQDAGQPARLPVAARAGEGPLFTMRTPRAVPLRMGVLDGYDGEHWWTQEVGADLPGLGAGEIAQVQAPLRDIATAFVTVDSTQLGRIVPVVPGTFEVSGLPADTAVLPDASALRLPVSAEAALGYTVRFARPDLSKLENMPLATTSETVRPGPLAQQILDDADAANTDDAAGSDTTTSWTRIQHVRRALFERATQGSVGAPTPVTPSRVEEILGGSPATGFELAAADALLIRWAGVPARLGYGYLTHQPNADGSFTFTAEQGAVWVEIRAEDGSWISLTDRPADSAQPAANPVHVLVPDGQRIATLFVPVQRTSPAVLTSAALWWVLCYLALALAGFALWLLVPTALRALRRRRRRQWAAGHGPVERIAVAYASVRDTAIDFNIGNAHQTPLEFLESVVPDRDHRELAWLVERSLWGDLRRGVEARDAEAAERLAASLRRRLTQGQNYAQRLLAFASLASLREPWQPELPNAYPSSWSRLSLRERSPWARRGLAAAVLAVAALLPFAVGIDRPDLRSDPTSAARLPTVPTSVGDVELREAPEGTATFERHRSGSLMDATAMYLVAAEGLDQGTLQVGVLKPGLRGANLQVRSGILTQLGMTDVQRIGQSVIYSRRLGDLTVSLWFAPSGDTFQLLTTTSAFPDPQRFLARAVAAGDGAGADLGVIEPVLPPDIRRGLYPADPPPFDDEFFDEDFPEGEAPEGELPEGEIPGEEVPGEDEAGPPADEGQPEEAGE